MRLVVPPASPISLAEAKSYLRVDDGDDDVLIAALLDAAAAYFDGFAGILCRALEPQTWETSLDAFPSSEIRVPFGPLVSAEVRYRDLDGFERVVAPESYVVDIASLDGWLIPVDPWPPAMAAVNAVTVRWVAGTGTPAPVRVAILLLLGAFYDVRGVEAEAPPAVRMLVEPYRHYAFG